MNKDEMETLKKFLLWDFIIDPLLFGATYFIERFGEHLTNTEYGTLGTLIIVGWCVRIVLWGGRMLWRNEINE